MDNLVFNNICEHLKPGLFIKDETVGALTKKFIIIDWCVCSLFHNIFIGEDV
jgi:hypothetical protein